MQIKANKTSVEGILSLRNLYLQELNSQVRFNNSFVRGWADIYLIETDNINIGYVAVRGQELKDRDTIFEFYIIPQYRKHYFEIFSELIKVTGVQFIECQSNDFLLSSILYEFSGNISSDTILFADNTVTQFSIPGAAFRKRKDDDIVFKHKIEPAGDYVIEYKNEIAATGGYMLYYNFPFTDLYMEVREDFQRKGFGTYIIQELKKSCYIEGRVPAARCPMWHKASKATLLKAGLKISGFMLKGSIKLP